MIYILEDDASIRNFVEYALCNSDLPAAGFERPSELWRAMENEIPQLLLLDIMLPEEDGLSVLKKLRGRPDTARLPIIMLTALDSEYDKVLGLDNGADDYISKPFGMMELISRIRALLRRTDTGDTPADYTVGSLFVSPTRRLVRSCDREVALTYKEFELLSLLLENIGSVMTRDQILRQVWGLGFDGENRTVDVHIRTLRSKLGKCGGLIHTVRGVGYKLEDSRDE